jgi:Ca2+-transporting ATPase
MTATCLALYYLIAPLLPGMTPDIDRTMLFTALVLTQLLHAFSFRSATNTVFSHRSFANKWLVLSLLGSMALQCVVIYLPAAQGIFKTAPLDAYQWACVIGASLAATVVIDSTKLVLATLKRTKGATA